MDVKGFVDLRRRIELAWSKETTFCPDTYEVQDPAYGQCGVTSVYLFDCFGGALIQGMVRDHPHYFNFFASSIVDLTWRQFPVGSSMTNLKLIRREDVIANPWFQERYAYFQKAMW